jgi:hypothetical protein
VLDPSPGGSLGRWEGWCLGNGVPDIWLRFWRHDKDIIDHNYDKHAGCI